MDGCWTLGGTFDEWQCERFRRTIPNPHIKPIIKMPKIVPKIVPNLLLLELGVEGLGGLEGLVSAVVAIITYVAVPDRTRILFCCIFRVHHRV